jgi:hypothetical protein
MTIQTSAASSVTLSSIMRPCCCTQDWGRWGHQMAGTDGGQLYGLVDEQTVYAALDAIDEALEQALIAPPSTSSAGS